MFSGLFKPRVDILGGDIAGRAEAAGADVKAFRPGDEVYSDLCMNGFGAFAEYVCAPEACLARKPDRMSLEQAAATPQAGMLAVQGLIDVGRVASGQKLLLNGAGGGVGTFALRIAKLYGVEVTVVDKPGKLDMLRAMGADHCSPLAYLQALNPNGTYATVNGSISRLLETVSLRPLVARVYHKHVRMVVLKPNKDLAS